MAFSDLQLDIRYAVRGLRKNPQFAAVAILSISLSVGAAAVVFAAIKSVLMDPLPFSRNQELVQLATDFANFERSNGDWVYANDAREIRRRTRTLESTGIYGNAVFDLAGAGSTPPEALYGLRISASLFPMLGVSPMLGRNVLPEEDRPGHGNVLILSHGLWTRRFNSDRSVIGRTVKVNGQDRVVIGVMPAGFNFPLRREAVRTPYSYVEFWAPLATDSPSGGLGMVARLKHGVTLPQARADLASISSALAREFPASNRDRSHRLAPMMERVVRNAAQALWLLMAAAALFLLIGCANVANLLLARGMARQREIVVRMAIGAGGGRIIRQLLTESFVLAAIGGMGGFAFAAIAWKLLPAIVPVSIPRLAAARGDWMVLLFAIAVAMTTGALFGIVPAIRATMFGRSLTDGALGTRGTSVGKHRASTALVGAEIALAVVLVVVGGQLAGAFVALIRTSPGFEADRVLASVVLPARERYKTQEQRATVYRRFLDAVRAMPGVESAGTVDALPFSGENHGGFVSADQQIAAEVDITGGDYLQAMGVRLLEGRWFRDDEMGASSRSAIVDETVAQRLWPNASAVGRRICTYCTPERPDNWMQVVGVVSSMRHSTLEGPVHQNVYLSGGALEQAAFLVIRTDRPMTEMDKGLRAAVASVDPDQPVLLSAPMRSFVSDSIADRRFIMSLLAITGCLALVMSAAGVYGVAAYATSRRTQEIGIRMALGAAPGSVQRLVFRQGFLAAMIGLLIGGGLAIVALRGLRGLLSGFESREPGFAIGAAVLVMAAAAAACWIPARRASRIDPMSALRRE